jgi:hypothetical protein
MKYRQSGDGHPAPLSPQVFQILVSLVREPRHGYALIQDIRERTDNEIHLTARGSSIRSPSESSRGNDHERAETAAPGNQLAGVEQCDEPRLPTIARIVPRCAARSLRQLFVEEQTHGSGRDGDSSALAEAALDNYFFNLNCAVKTWPGSNVSDSL